MLEEVLRFIDRKRRKGCSQQRKEHAFNCPIMLYVISTIHKITGIFYPTFFTPSASLIVLDFQYSFWGLEKNRAMGKGLVSCYGPG